MEAIRLAAAAGRAYVGGDATAAGRAYGAQHGASRIEAAQLAGAFEMGARQAKRPAAPVAAPADPIRAAYLKVTGGELNCRARIADIKAARPAITDWDLLAYARAGRGTLIEMDNRREITPADRAAAVTLGGEPRHILWIER